MPWLTRGDAARQDLGQASVDAHSRLAEDARQFKCLDKQHPAEGIDELSF